MRHFTGRLLNLLHSYNRGTMRGMCNVFCTLLLTFIIKTLNWVLMFTFLVFRYGQVHEALHSRWDFLRILSLVCIWTLMQSKCNNGGYHEQRLLLTLLLEISWKLLTKNLFQCNVYCQCRLLYILHPVFSPPCSHHIPPSRALVEESYIPIFQDSCSFGPWSCDHPDS